MFRRETFSNGKLWIAVGGVAVLQAAAVHFGPVQNIFGTADLTLADWAVAIGLASSILWFDDARKLVLRLRSAD